MRFITTVLALLLYTAANAQKLNTRKLDSLFNMLQSHGLANGSVAISIDGKVVYQKAIGFTSLENNKKTTPNIHTKYRIGSVSKLFTATMIFQLIEAGKLNLDDKLSTWFPGLPNAGKITIRLMLYHRSGLHDYTKDTNFPDWMDKPQTEAQMLKIITEKGTDFEPGTKADYCNTNYLLLSYIIEKIDRQPYEATVQKRIISKLKLPDTYYGKPISIARNESFSYKYSDSTWKIQKATDPGIHKGAGSLVSTPADLTTFIHQLFTGQLISQTSLAKMTTMIDDYGMGIFPYDFDGAKGYGHYGRIEEFYTALRYYPEQKLAISYTTNGILYPRRDIVEGVLKICFNDNYTIPFSKPITGQSSDLDKYLGEYASGDLPFKVICKKENNILILEAAGRTMIAEPVTTDYFMNLKTGTFFQFYPQSGELQIKETDNVYYLSKSK
jgi:CubicO group peptidase (beta-lactamase class C family)